MAKGKNRDSIERVAVDRVGIALCKFANGSCRCETRGSNCCESACAPARRILNIAQQALSAMEEIDAKAE